MEQLVVKCRCRGTNAGCHVCFGTGDVLASPAVPEQIHVAAPAVRRQPVAAAAAPEKRAAQKPDLETLFARHAGMGNADAARSALWAARAARKKCPELPRLMAESLKCARPQFVDFVKALVGAIRDVEASVHGVLVDVNGALRDGGSAARLTAEHVAAMRKAWRKGSVSEDKEAAVAVAHPAEAAGHMPPGVRVLQTLSPGQARKVARKTDRNSPFAVLDPMAGGKARIEHVLAVSSGAPLPTRIDQLSRFVGRHRIGRVYFASGKKVLRSVSEILGGVQAVHVENPANVDFIRKGSGVAVFDLDSANG